MCTEQEDCDRVIRVLKSDWGSNVKRKIVDEKRFEGECACSVTKEKRRKKKSEAHETCSQGGEFRGFGLGLPNNNKRMIS